jgi:hypothetical protein
MTIELEHEIDLTEKDNLTLLTVPSTGQVLCLNPTARIVVMMLAEGTSRDAIVAAIMEAFDEDDATRVRLDLNECLFDLAQEGLLDRGIL